MYDQFNNCKQKVFTIPTTGCARKQDDGVGQGRAGSYGVTAEMLIFSLVWWGHFP
jgi:hypothetical protein